jgi:hypothetical protein
MKLTTIAALTAGIATPACAAPTIGMIVDTTSAFLVANGLASARIVITGWEPGTRYLGIIGTEDHPWLVRTRTGLGFYNINSVCCYTSGSPIFVDGFYAAPSNNAFLNSFAPGAPWDSGLLGSATNNPNPSNLGTPSDADATDDVGGFAMFSAGGDSDCLIEPMQWLTTNPVGLVPPATLNVMRITAKRFTGGAWVRFVLVMANGEQIPMEIYAMFLLTHCNGDLNGDYQVNIADVLDMIAHWGTACGSGDINNDGTVNVADLLALLSNWGPCFQ